MPEWENVVQGMIDRFGSDAQTVGVLLAFLKCLVEESGNPRIAISVRLICSRSGTVDGRRDKENERLTSGVERSSSCVSWTDDQRKCGERATGLDHVHSGSRCVFGRVLPRD